MVVVTEPCDCWSCCRMPTTCKINNLVKFPVAFLWQQLSCHPLVHVLSHTHLYDICHTLFWNGCHLVFLRSEIAFKDYVRFFPPAWKVTSNIIIFRVAIQKKSTYYLNYLLLNYIIPNAKSIQTIKKNDKSTKFLKSFTKVLQK